MYGPDRLEVFSLQKVPDGLEVLDANTLVVLGPTSEDLAVGGYDGGEGWVGPVVGLGGDGVEVGVEEERGEVGPGAGPGEKDDRLVGDVL